ncbi:MAG: deaD 2 [Burkholderiaceae bacterium]|nr:deaD 2 [Burkholderiaceae bacterium]
MTTTLQATPISFEEMGLADTFLTSINALGYTQPTAVQSALIPCAMAGGDWIVASQTGSGKTAAFLLPSLQKILTAVNSGKNNPANAPFTLVLCPTRELAQQVSADAINLVKNTRGLRIATIVGGTSYFKQKQGLKGAHLVVATPGRLLDWVNQGGINLSQLQTLVLDEADRMLDLGFTDEITAIAEACEHREQTLMFSATFTPRETRLAGALMLEPQQIMLASVSEKHTSITQHLQWADNSHHQQKLLMHWLQDDTLDQAVVFASTQIDCERLADELAGMGVSAAALHGAMPQMVRNRRLDALRKGKTKILVATDVAARGIDVPNITHVFNYGLPMKAEDYVHRIGRTGRAGREGVAVTFAQRSDAFKIRQIERYIERKINVTQVAGLEPQLKAEDFASGRGGKPAGRSNSRGGYAGKPRGEYRTGARGDAPRGAHGGHGSRPDTRPEGRGFRAEGRADTHGGYRNEPRSEGRSEYRGAPANGNRSDSRNDNRNPSSPHTRVRHESHLEKHADGRFHERSDARPKHRASAGEEYRPRREHHSKQGEKSYVKPAARPFANTARPTGQAKPRANRKPSF